MAAAVKMRMRCFEFGDLGRDCWCMHIFVVADRRRMQSELSAPQVGSSDYAVNSVKFG